MVYLKLNPSLVCNSVSLFVVVDETDNDVEIYYIYLYQLLALVMVIELSGVQFV